MPSPTATTTAPADCSALTRASLPSGSSRAAWRPMPPSAAMRATATASSPLAISDSRPEPARSRDALDGLGAELVGQPKRRERVRSASPRQTQLSPSSASGAAAPGREARRERRAGRRATAGPRPSPSMPSPAWTCDLAGRPPRSTPDARKALAIGCSDMRSSADREFQALGLRQTPRAGGLPRRGSGRGSACRSCPRARASALASDLERVGVRDQHAAPRERRGRRGDGRGRGERQRAGAGHDQHGERRRQGPRRVDEPPDREDDRGAEQDSAEEPGRRAIGRASRGAAAPPAPARAGRRCRRAPCGPRPRRPAPGAARRDSGCRRARVAPAAFATAVDSPVSMDSSTRPGALGARSPSAANTSPVRTRMLVAGLRARRPARPRTATVAQRAAR